jgi:mercuric ion transport protein
MGDRALVGAGMAGAILAAICCAGPVLATALPLAGLGAWLASGVRVLALIAAGLGIVVWAIRRRAKAPSCKATIRQGSAKP